jgi:hypothetical protein
VDLKSGAGGHERRGENLQVDEFTLVVLHGCDFVVRFEGSWEVLLGELSQIVVGKVLEIEFR